MNETIFAKGKIFELVHFTQPDGRVFEVARRAPGVRLIIADKKAKKVLLTKEHRWELQDWDYRLPGGKVFDTLAEYEAHRLKQGDIVKAATAKAKEEAAEEAGMAISGLTLFKKSSLGATVEWDLYIFEATDWHIHKDGQNLKDDERMGIDVTFYDYAEVETMILAGKMQEERVALVLLQWLRGEK